MEEIRLWKVSTNPTDKAKALPVEAIAETTTEKLLEDVLTGSPDVLMPNLKLVGRQTETPGGPLDLLGVDEDGRLVVFELKRGSLTRDAVAQAIDYASYLADLEIDDLCRHIAGNSGRGGTEQIVDFAEWYQNHFQKPAAHG
jgi:RecB family endonuclease NucS